MMMTTNTFVVFHLVVALVMLWMLQLEESRVKVGGGLGVLGQLSCTPAAPPGTAANVWGQSTFTTSASGTALNQLDQPEDVHIDPSSLKIFVSDSSNQRILRFSFFLPPFLIF